MKKNLKINLMIILAGFLLAVCFTSCKKEESQLTGTDSETAEDFSTGKLLPPVVPANLVVPAGNKVFLRYYASGYQIYKCLPTVADPNIYAWTFQSPIANLYCRSNFTHLAGTHYAGPTWANLHGGNVVGVKLQGANSPDPNAIPWLLLQKVSIAGNGNITQTTYIQRVNTTGGIAPTTNADAAHANQVVQIPYTAEYFLYKPI